MNENEPLAEPLLVPPEIPRTLNQTRRYAGHRFLAGTGTRPARVMFVATSGLEEEHQDHIKNRGYGPPIKDAPRYLKGASGQVLQNLTGACGLNLEQNYYTALIKWLPPKAKRLKPTKEMVAAALPLLMWEIEQVDPDIIVCLGKPAFDALYPVRYKLSDIAGGWFQQDLAGKMRRLYPMECVTKLATKPEFTERFRMDLREVRRMLDEIDGLWVESHPQNYRTVTNRVELESLVSEIESENAKILSVDCEWHGPNHVDGQLRSLQICWKPGYAAYIRFMDDQLNYAFDIPYADAGAILSRYLDRPDVKYVGHHISADLPWMHHVLGLEWYEKVHLDTEFAQQCVDEHGELGLERMCMTYTTLGRWDLELTEWCKKNGKLVEDGYGLIPDSILIPYSQKDVDGPMRAYPYIEKRLKNEYQGEAWRYYSTLFNAFVTDIFTSFALEGLPVNIERANELRDLYQYVRRELHHEFGDLVVRESERLLRARLMAWDVLEGNKLYNTLYEMVGSGDPDGAGRLLWDTLPTDLHPQFTALWKHYLLAPEFNINSPAHVRPWLFEVKGYTPIKSTNQKEKGLPSMPWAKVLELPPERQREFTPSTDSQTLEILGTTHQDPVLQKLLEFKAVNNVCKSFLGEPDRDQDTGEVIKEKGLMYYVAGDGCIHAMTSSTETGRPRSWKPNLLNLPGWVNKKIVNGMVDILKDRREKGTLPPEFEIYAENPKRIPSVRSIITAPDGFCIVESDYATAELRGWAWISGDRKMMDLILKPDPCFARVKASSRYVNEKGEVDEDTVCRLTFPDHVQGDTRKWVMTYGVAGEVLKRFTHEDLVWGPDGRPIYAKQDLHWSLAEMAHKRPREELVAKRDRGASKIVNFSSAYGASGATLERKIESDTGIKPEPGEGQRMLDALIRRQPRAFEFMEEMERAPKDPGYLIAKSGRVRHFHLHSESLVGEWAYRGMAGAQGRESRNFFMQESVGATAARAAVWLYRFKRKFGLQGRPIAVLYDSVVTLCPNGEREIWKKAHDLFMWLGNGWAYEDRVLRYPVDHELNQSWSFKPTKEQLERIENTALATTPEALSANKWLDACLALVSDNEQLSTLGCDWMFSRIRVPD